MHIKTLYFLFFLISLFFSSGCILSDSNKNLDKEIIENIFNAEVFFCSMDDCEDVIVKEIEFAETAVHCAFFDLDLKDLIKAIAKKSHEADVRVVIDKGNYDGQIKGPGIKVVKSKQYMHNKFCIIDGKKIITGSMNPTDRGANYNDNNLLVITSDILSLNYEDEFNELWNGILGSGTKTKIKRFNSKMGIIENYFFPEDNMEKFGMNNIIIHLKSANKSIKLAGFSFTHENIADELIKADIRGIDVQVIFERKQRNEQNSQYSRLRDFGLDVKVDGNKYNMHHKFIVIDDTIVITGSPNFSFSGYNRNDENMLILDVKSIGSEYAEEFKRLYKESEVI